MAGRIIEQFDTANCEWSSIEAVNSDGKKITEIRQVAYHIIGNGNKYPYAVIAIDRNANNKMLEEVKQSEGEDLLDLEFNVKIAYKDKVVPRLQHKILKGVQISEQLQDQNGYMIYRCLFLKVE